MKTIVLFCFSVFFFSVSFSQEIIEVEEEEIDGFVEYPFTVVEIPAKFKGCKKEKAENFKECFEIELNKFISKKVKYPKGVSIDSSKKNKVFALFKIDTEGRVFNIRVRTSIEEFRKEVVRVLNKLPKFEPATHGGDNVIMIYTLRMDFSEYKK
jgi:protein TonB